MAKQKKVIAQPKRLTLAAIEPIKTDYYHTDFYKWTHEQAQLLEKADYSKLDIENLVEELHSLGKQEQQRLESFLKVLLMHLLKIKYQSGMKTNSWDASVKASRYQAQRVYQDNPSLKHSLNTIFMEAYFLARLDAVRETGLPEQTFPEKCPWTIDEVLHIETEPKMVHKPKKQRKSELT